MCRRGAHSEDISTSAPTETTASTGGPTETAASTGGPAQSSAPSTQSQTGGDTTTTPAPSSDNSGTSSHHTAVVAATAVVGVLVVIAVAAIAYWCLRRRRTHSAAPPTTETKWYPGLSQSPHTPSSTSRFPLLARFTSSRQESVPTPYILPLPVPPPGAAKSFSPPPSKRKGAPSMIYPPPHTSASSSLASGDRVLHLTPARGIPAVTSGAPPTPFSPSSLAGIPPGSAASLSFPMSMPISVVGEDEGVRLEPSSPASPVSPVSLVPSASVSTGPTEFDRAFVLAPHSSRFTQDSDQSQPQSPWSSPTTTIASPVSGAVSVASAGESPSASASTVDGDKAVTERGRAQPVRDRNGARARGLEGQLDPTRRPRISVAGYEDANEGLPPPPYAAATAGLRRDESSDFSA
ncbi:hypothetical protein C8Q80DRAFT_429996 [Daedaleopsis nitida]|nr:hypothetical protein C8Q80DRAFT_429996 [Daedaleopsis nitida]